MSKRKCVNKICGDQVVFRPMVIIQDTRIWKTFMNVCFKMVFTLVTWFILCIIFPHSLHSIFVLAWTSERCLVSFVLFLKLLPQDVQSIVRTSIFRTERASNFHACVNIYYAVYNNLDVKLLPGLQYFCLNIYHIFLDIFSRKMGQSDLEKHGAGRT